MNTNGSKKIRITNNQSVDAGPNFSPNGKKIVFASDRNSNFEIYKMRADGSGQKRLTSNFAFDAMPAFSPDGKQITFVSARDSSGSTINAELYKMNADGERLRARLATALISCDEDPRTPFAGPEPRYSYRLSGSGPVTSGDALPDLLIHIPYQQAGLPE
jgi:Tol biopolymer transport system component